MDKVLKSKNTSVDRLNEIEKLSEKIDFSLLNGDTLIEEDGVESTELTKVDSQDNIEPSRYSKMDTDTVRVVLKEIGEIPMLSKEEEEILPLKVYYEHDESAKNRIVSANLKLVYSVAKRYTWSGIHILDLYQEGCLGLIKSIEKFNPNYNCKISTYATWWIKQAITRYIADFGHTIRLPVHLVECINKVKRAQKDLVQVLGREPNADDIAKETGYPVFKVYEYLSLGADPVSLETPVGEDEDSVLGDFISIDSNTDLADISEDDDRRKMIEKTLSMLNDDRMEMIIRMRYGLDGTGRPKTLQECGEYFGVTRERVRQLENKAMRKIRSYAIKTGLVAYRESNPKKI